ncbi:MAG: tetratricopeptide repeat protein [Thermoanaerobaculia bacterium]|nr:tetratricopeptide repeat protein [Thermoanaerobaculia bacterium]
MRSTRHGLMRVLLGILLVVGLVSPSEAAREASVGGTVEDMEGEPLSGVHVTVFSEEEERTDTTNRKGRFRILVMDATQRFMIRLEKEGYVTVERPLQVQVGANVNTTWQMAAITGAEEVEGSSEAIEAYNMGAAAYNEQNFEEARGYFQKALELNPDLVEARRVLTLTQFQMQDWQSAVDSVEQLIELEADDEAALMMGFDAATQLGDLDRAERYLEELLAGEPNAEIAARVYNFGVAELRAGNREAAAARFEKAIELAPELGAAYNGLATIYLEDEQYDRALEMADRLLEVDPGNAEALGIRYEVYRRQGDEEKMEAALEELQASDPERIVDAYYKQGTLLFENGEAEEAVEAFQRVLRADPDHPRANYQLGRCYLSLNRLEEARTHLERFVELAPDDPEAPSAREMLSYLE